LSRTQHKLLNLLRYRATYDLRAFLIIPVTENNPSTGTDKARGQIHKR